jgi:type IV secretory pathway VirB4 component
MNPNQQNQPTPGLPPQGGATYMPQTGGVQAPQGMVSPQAAGAKTPGVHSNPNSTQNTLQIAEIRDGIVIMNDGSFRSVVMVKSVNFDLMSPQEQEAVEFSYQGFLNSLYFPIQIFIRSQKVDLQPYIARLDKIRTEHENMLLAMLMDDYIGFIEQLSTQTNIMDKRFYIVIPFLPHVDVQKAITQSKNFITGLAGLFNTKEQHVVINEANLEKAKTELKNRVQAVLQGLAQCNIQGLPLDTQELIELYYDTYNPDTATRQPLKNFDDLTPDVVTKGQGTAPQSHLQRELN